jgi:hypothetical protein
MQGRRRAIAARLHFINGMPTGCRYAVAGTGCGAAVPACTGIVGSGRRHMPFGPSAISASVLQ